jgi:hypothetical protein
VEKPEEERSLGRPRQRWEDIIKMDLKQDAKATTGRTGCGQGQKVGCEHGNDPLDSIIWELLVTG